MAIMSYVCEVQTVFNVVQNPLMILLCESRADGDSARCEQVYRMLPQRSQGSTLKNHMLCRGSVEIGKIYHFPFVIIYRCTMPH